MKKLLLFILAILCILGITFIVVTPISPEDSLDNEFKLIQSEYFDDICEQADVDVRAIVKNTFAESNITLSDEEADILLATLLDFDYTIHQSTIYDDYADVSVTIVTVDLVKLTKEQIKDNIGNIIVGVLKGEGVSDEAIVKEVIAELENTPKTYTATIDVRVNDINGIFYLIDFENNSDLYNAICGNLLYELNMLESNNGK